MLFNEDEVNRLGLFSQIAQIANGLEGIAQTTQTTIYIIDKNRKTGVDFFNTFKSFIFKFDILLISLDINIAEYKKIIDKLEVSLKEDDFILNYNENALVFNFVVKLKICMDDILHLCQLKITNFTIIWNSNSELVYFYDLLLKIINFNNLSEGNSNFNNKILIIRPLAKVVIASSSDLPVQRLS